MTDMITLAARAILKSRYYEPEHHPDLESFYASCYPEHVMEAEAEARAVFDVFGEADDAFMDLVADRAHDGRFSRSGETYPVLRNFLRAFVDAALASPPTPEDVNGESK